MYTVITNQGKDTTTRLTERQARGMTAMRFLRRCRRAKANHGKLYLRDGYVLVTVAVCGCGKLGYEVAWMNHDPCYGNMGLSAYCEDCWAPEERCYPDFEK